LDNKRTKGPIGSALWMEALGQERQDIYERTVQLGLPCLYYPLTKIEGEENRIEDRSGYELHARVVMREGGQPPSFVAGAAGSAIDLKGAHKRTECPLSWENPSHTLSPSRGELRVLP